MARRARGEPVPSRPAAARTAQPVGGDVLQHGEGHAEEGDEEVAERQGADEDVGDRPHGAAAGDHVEHQAVAEQRQGEDERADEDEGGLGAPGQLGDVDERPQPVQGDELLPRHVVVPQELRELLRGDVQGPHGDTFTSHPPSSQPLSAPGRPRVTLPVRSGGAPAPPRPPLRPAANFEAAAASGRGGGSGGGQSARSAGPPR